MTGTVLIVDDDESVTRSLVRLLSLHGYLARGETSAAAAIAAAVEHKATVILLDLHMRHCSGIELARQFRAEPPIAGARLIGMSATVPDWDAEELAIFDAVLAKPFLSESLLAAVRG